MIITVGHKVKDSEGNIYQLTKDIGQGGFGCVYQAVREKDGKIFAVKTLLNSFKDTNDVLSFKNEIALAQQVKGENIIDYIYVHNGEQFPDLPPYIIMEYANGGTLRDKIKDMKKAKTNISVKELITLYKQLIDGMKNINERLVHRDIKPENILISDGVLKLSDFGLAKIVTESTRTMSFKGYGTIPYIAPEAWNNQKNTIQMDIYSMGIVFYELAMLTYPYDVKNENYEAYKNAHIYSGVKDISLLQKRTSPVITSVILRMLEKPTQKRFNSWDDILKQINKDFKSESILDSMVLSTISEKNRREILKQQQIDSINKQQQETYNFYRLVISQFESAILNRIKEFVEKFNDSNSSVEKCVLQYNNRIQETFQAYLEIPTITRITIKGKAILPNSEIKEIFNPYENRKYSINYTPKFLERNIIGWIEIENRNEYGFNLMLVKSDNLYGDWFIMENSNNFSKLGGRKREMPEPFAFSVDCLDEALKSINSTSYYSSKAIPFEENQFLKFLAILLN